MPERLRDINLLPTYERQSSSSFYIFIALIIITLLAFAFIGYTYLTTTKKVNTAEEEYAELREEADQLQMQVTQLETDGDSLEQAVVFAKEYDIPTSAFIVELNNLLPDNSYLDEYAYGSEGAKVIAHFETLDAVANYTTNLVTSKFVQDTKIDEVETFGLREEIDPDNKVNFEIIPRYESEFTLKINKQKLKGDTEEDE